MRTARVLVMSGALAAWALAASAPADDKTVDANVTWSLRWLKNHQAPDGHWDAKSYDAQCKLNRCDGPGDAPHATTATGLALLAFLGAGQTQQFGPYKASIQQGLSYLAKVQADDGFLGDPKADGALVGHAIAALALTEARGMTGDAQLEAPARKAVNALFKSSAAAGPWRADFAKDAAVEPRSLPWTACVLQSGAMSKLDVDPDAMKRVVAWFEARTDSKTGAVSDPTAKRTDDLLTAAGVLARAFAGRSPKTDPTMSAAAATLAKNVAWETTTPTTRHFASLAVFLAATDAERTRWSAAAKTALEKAERMEPDRDERGSWDARHEWTGAEGRLVATALSCMTLEVVSRR